MTTDFINPEVMSKMKHSGFSFAPPAQQVFQICRACKLITEESSRVGWAN